MLLRLVSLQVGEQKTGRLVAVATGSGAEPVEHRGGDRGVADGAGPVGDPDVGRQDRARSRYRRFITWNSAEVPSSGSGR